MIPFNSNKTAFGRHETFPLRFGWLTKGYRNWCENPQALLEEDPTVVLGVGKNMVGSMRYWLMAAQIASAVGPHGLKPTQIGELLFSTQSGWDPYLEDDTSLWLLHWLIASNAMDATAFYWYFNRYHKPEFTNGEVLAGLSDFVRENVKARAAETTLRHDINVLLRMYGPSEQSKGLPVEESLDSPMTTLGLIQRAGDAKYFVSRVSDRRRLPVAAFGFAVLDVMEAVKRNSLPVERLMRSDNYYAAPGSVFRLTENALITKIEELLRWLPGVLELRESAGLHQLYLLKECSKYQLLAQHYVGSRLEKAA